MKALFFSSPLEFRFWLEKNHKTKTELVVGFYKVRSGKPSMTWSQSVDQALCFGWIDSVRRTIDSESYCIRFTPRKRNSIWSEVNIKKVSALKKAGLMTKDGLEAYSWKKEHRAGIYSHEKEIPAIAPLYEAQFKKNKKAWLFFNTQAPSYKKVIIHWIMSAKQDKTKQSRLEKAIKFSLEQKRII